MFKSPYNVKKFTVQILRLKFQFAIFISICDQLKTEFFLNLVIHNIFQVRSLCRDWFPIEYPQSWYEDITSSERFFALAAVYKSQIIGLIVAEIKPYLKLNAEDRGILSRWFASKDTLVAYILSLGKSC